MLPFYGQTQLPIKKIYSEAQFINNRLRIPQYIVACGRDSTGFQCISKTKHYKWLSSTSRKVDEGGCIIPPGKIKRDGYTSLHKGLTPLIHTPKTAKVRHPFRFKCNINKTLYTPLMLKLSDKKKILPKGDQLYCMIDLLGSVEFPTIWVIAKSKWILKK